MALLEIKSLKKIYSTRLSGNKVQALDSVAFSVEEGEYVAIMGESGSGKTTLLNILASRLSVMGIRKNGSAYIPYILASIFSVFIFLVFSSILKNDIMKTLPHSGYIWALMQIGLYLLAFIPLPFLMYTNSFLIKRRKKGT